MSKRRRTTAEDEWDDDVDDFEDDDADGSLEDYLEEETDDDDSDRGADFSLTDMEPEVGKVRQALGFVKSQFESPPARPGEQDILRNRFVITMVVGAVSLLLISATFWFIIGRDAKQQMFDAAHAALEEGRFTPAINQYMEFITIYGTKDDYYPQAWFELSRARVLKEITGSTPDWEKGVTEVQDFIDRHRDHEEFAEHHAELAEYGKDIALGAAKTAQSTKKREVLAYIDSGQRILERYSPKDAPPTDILAQIEAEKIKAEAAVLKQETIDAALAEIDEYLKNQQPMQALEARRRLLERYSDLENDRTLAQRMSQILDTERKLVQTLDRSRDASTTEPQQAFQKPLTLVLHVRSLTSDISEGRSVIAVAKDSCYAIDTVTGDPVWKRVIGLDSPFFPLEVTTSVPGVLYFDTNSGELTVVDRNTGGLVWRQKLDDVVTGTPLVDGGQIYVAVRGGKLYKIDLGSGRMTAEMQFSQDLTGSPALTSDGDYLIVAGDREVIYTLTVRPLECQSVTYLEHKAGSIRAPLATMGSLLLISENDRADSCRLRILDTSNIGQSLVEKNSVRVAGQVIDRPILRGNQLFVPSTDERIAAFTVSDDPNQRTMTPVAPFQLESPTPSPLFLAAGPDGQLWLASSALRKFEVKADAIQLDPQKIAIGISTQPLQTIGQFLFVGRRLPHSGGVVFTRVDRGPMTSEWKTTVGESIVQAVPAGNQGVLCLTEGGDLFFVDQRLLEQGGFKFRADAQLQLPESLQDPLRATQFADGRLAAYCGAPEPFLWTVTTQGQIEQKVPLEEPLEAAPILIGGNIVLPLPGRLRMIQRSGRRVGEDFLPIVETEGTRTWTSVQALSDNQMVACDSTGRLVRLEFRTSPVPHLAEVARVELEAPVNVGFIVSQNLVIVADSTGRLQVLDALGLEPKAERQFQGTVSNDLWLVENSLFVETGENELHCVEVGPELADRWTLPLGGSGLAGAPFSAGGYLVVALRDGEILALDTNSGEVKNRSTTGQPLASGPISFGRSLTAGTIDGSLYRIESILEAAP